MVWLKNTNATASDVLCSGPGDMKGKKLNDLPLPPGECISTGDPVDTHTSTRTHTHKHAHTHHYA